MFRIRTINTTKMKTVLNNYEKKSLTSNSVIKKEEQLLAAAPSKAYASFFIKKTKTSLINFKKIDGTNFRHNNLFLVSPNILRGSQPTEQGIKDLAKSGVKVIVDLRKSTNQFNELSALKEQALAEKYGMKYVNIQLDERVNPSEETMQEIYKYLDNAKNEPVFYHCRAGQDRTGIVTARYRVDKEDWDFNKAYDEMLNFTHDFMAFNNLDKFLLNHCKQKDLAQGIQRKYIVEETQAKYREQLLDAYYR